MSMTMDDSIKRWTAKRKTALVIEIIQGKTTVAEASRSVILPVLTGRNLRTHAAIFSFMAGVTPPMPMLGRSLL